MLLASSGALRARAALVLSTLILGLGTSTTPALAATPSFQELFPPPMPQPAERPRPIESQSSDQAAVLPGEEHAKLIDQRRNLGSMGPDLMGDRTNFQTGSTEFVHIDISLPGNDALPVELIRRYSIKPRARQEPSLREAAFADWELDVPYLSGVFARRTGWQVATQGGSTSNRCSVTDQSFAVPPEQMMSEGTYPHRFLPHEYWQGYNLSLPGGGGGELLWLSPSSTRPRPSTGGPFYWVTNGNWIFSCQNTNAPGGETFVGHAPDGRRYYFTHQVQRLADKLSAQQGDARLDRVEVRLYATRIEDQFGNWVAYNWSGNRLQSITSKDDRRIDLTYNPTTGHVASATDGIGTWIYEYSGDGSIYARHSLSKVRRPDASTWRIQFSQLSDALLFYGRGDESGANCYGPGDARTLTPDGQFSGSMTHPSGATATFVVAPTRHGHTQVPRICFNENNQIPAATYSWYTLSYDVLSLLQKSVSGGGVATQQWNYTYEPSACFQGECTFQPDYSVTTVRNPDGSATRYRFGTRFNGNQGKLLQVETASALIGATLQDVKRTEVMTYRLVEDAIAPSPQYRGNSFSAERFLPQQTKVVTQDGISFSWQALSYNTWGLPLEVTRSSSLGYSKGEIFVFRDLLGMWILNQPFSRRDRDLGVTEEQRFYVGSQINRIVSFGLPDFTRWYNTDGTLAQALTLAGNTISLQDYYRGVPRRVVHGADNSAISATVDGLGRVRSLTDALTNTTSLEYDALGRLTQTRFPSGDSTTWNNEDAAYLIRNTVEYGIPAGLWKRISTRGRYEHVTWYDAFWRPILTRERDVNVADSERFVRKAYDTRGNLSFESYPGVLPSISTSYATLTSGISRQYDVLDRPTIETRSSELGNLVSRREYLAGFQVRDTNARNQVTTTRFMAYDEPTYDWPMRIDEPEYKSTVFQRDRWGKPTAVTRDGWYLLPNGSWEQNSATRRFVYDANQRLCKRIDPEHGATVMDYDSANRLAWTADGLNLPSTTECNRESVAANQRVVRSYNTKDELTGIDYPDSTDDLSFTYYADGKPQTASVGPLGNRISRTYSYNKRRLPTQELLQIDGFSFPIGYRYSSEGAVSELGYPDNTWEALNPDGLGRPRQMGQFASNVSWHRFGPLASLKYSNGLSFSQTLNARGLPSERRDDAFGSARLRDSLNWDGNGNLTAINDLVGDANAYRNASRSMIYDGLDRLTVANSAPQPQLRTETPWAYSWGEARFSYDGLDNLRTFKMGAVDFSYAYASNGLLQSVSQAGVSTPVLNYAHNARGQMTGRQFGGQQFTLSWDSAHRVTQTWNAANSVVESYRYDAHGHRARTVRGGETVYQVYTQSGDLLMERTSAGTTRKYARLGGRLIGETVNGARRAIHTDVIGSVRQKTDAFGTIVHEDVRAPYGSTLIGWQYQNGPAFTGHMEDGATGLTYMKARYYDPVAMRFISPDPVYVDLGTGGNFNRYWYANNNPYTYVDPDGRHPLAQAFSGHFQFGYSHQQQTYHRYSRYAADFRERSQISASVSAANGLGLRGKQDLITGRTSLGIVFLGLGARGEVGAAYRVGRIEWSSVDAPVDIDLSVGAGPLDIELNFDPGGRIDLNVGYSQGGGFYGGGAIMFDERLLDEPVARQRERDSTNAIEIVRVNGRIDSANLRRGKE